MENTRKYPVGIQTFSRIRKENYLYIDKTDLMWKMTKLSPYIFLSRPRRFGKSLLTTTLDAYFKGQKELFEGLKFLEAAPLAFEPAFTTYPIFKLDFMSVRFGKAAELLASIHKHILLFDQTYKHLHASGGLCDCV